MAWKTPKARHSHAEFRHSTSNSKNINTENTKIGERWGSVPPGMGGVADPKKHAPPHMCYLAERGRSALKVAGITHKMGSAGGPPFGT